MKHGVMDDTVPHRCFVDMSNLWVTDVKIAVRAVRVRLIFEFPVQGKNILLQMPLKLQYVFFLALVSAESFPRNEETFGRNYQIMNIFKRFHG